MSLVVIVLVLSFPFYVFPVWMLIHCSMREDLPSGSRGWWTFLMVAGFPIAAFFYGLLIAKHLAIRLIALILLMLVTTAVSLMLIGGWAVTSTNGNALNLPGLWQRLYPSLSSSADQEEVRKSFEELDILLQQAQAGKLETHRVEAVFARTAKTLEKNSTTEVPVISEEPERIRIDDYEKYPG